MHNDVDRGSLAGPAASQLATHQLAAGPVKKVLLGLLKYGISLSILAYLFYQAAQDQSFAALRHQPKHWGLLTAAFALALSGVALTMVRWYLLVQALHLRFTLRDAFRLGFVGYLFNFLTLGIIGGDALKAVFIAHEQHGRRTEAVATVVVDRIIGLYALFVLASLAFLFVDLDALQVRNPGQLEFVRMVGRVSCTLSIAGALGLGVLLLPGFTTGAFWDALVRLPRVGGTVERLIAAVRMYRRRIGLLLLTLLMSLVTHSLFTVSIYSIARGLPGAEPSLGTHFVIVPIANVAGALPLPGGMGPFEYTLDLLYRVVSTVEVAPRQGFVVALAFRVVTLMIALIGAFYYLTSRREVDQLLKEAEQEVADEAA